MKHKFNAYLLSDGRIVRKTTWDMLWHVIYHVDTKPVRLTWDRISARKAKRLRFEYQARPCWIAI